MNKYKQTWLAAAVVAAVGSVGVVWAADEPPSRPEGCTCCRMHGGGGPGGAMRHGPGPMAMRAGMRKLVGEHVLEQLDLSDEQKAKVKAIMDSRKDEGRAMMEKIGAEHMALQKLIMADTLDEQALRAQAAKLAALEADAAVARAKVSHEIRALLTPEQAQKAKDMQAKFEARMKAHGPLGERPEKQ
jgi:protein CpxP